MHDCKKCKVLRQILEGKNKLLTCYRLGTRCGIDGALDKITKAERQLAELDKEAE
jgi:hypothetical protein